VRAVPQPAPQPHGRRTPQRAAYGTAQRRQQARRRTDADDHLLRSSLAPRRFLRHAPAPPSVFTRSGSRPDTCFGRPRCHLRSAAPVAPARGARRPRRSVWRPRHSRGTCDPGRSAPCSALGVGHTNCYPLGAARASPRPESLGSFGSRLDTLPIMIASRRTYARSCLMVCAAALLLASAAAAQSITGGTLEGVVRGTDGEPVMDARVMVAHRETGAARGAVTSDQGRFRIGFLPPGEYDISVEQLGYRPRRIVGVPISAGQSLSLEIRIEAAPPPIEDVDVGTLDLGALTGSAAGTTQRFSRFELSALPDASRELTDLARLATKSNEALETEGLPASLTRLSIDGSPFTAAAHPDIA